MVMWKMVLLFSCLVVCTNLLQYCQTTRQQNNKTTKQQNNKTTKQQNNKSVWKTVSFSIRKKNQEIKIRLKK